MDDLKFRNNKEFGKWLRSQAIRDLFRFDAIQDLIQTGEISDSLRSYEDFEDFSKRTKCDKKFVESIRESFHEFVKLKTQGTPKLKSKQFKTIYKSMLKGQNSIKQAFDDLNSSLLITDKLDLTIYGSFNNICIELEQLKTHLGDLAHSKLEIDQPRRIYNLLADLEPQKDVNRVYFDEKLFDAAKSAMSEK